jgi:hypothetical protein
MYGTIIYPWIQIYHDYLEDLDDNNKGILHQIFKSKINMNFFNQKLSIIYEIESSQAW